MKDHVDFRTGLESPFWSSSPLSLYRLVEKMWHKLVCSVLYSLIAIKNVSHAANDEYNAEITLLGGKFRMGSSTADTKRGELSVKTVGLKPFVIDKYPVTNENFRKFVRVKKFKTEAERFGWSFVFHSFVSKEVRSKITQSVPVTEVTLYQSFL